MSEIVKNYKTLPQRDGYKLENLSNMNKDTMMSLNKNKNVSALKHKNIPFKVTSASDGFSEGMKRDITSLVSDNVPDKKAMCN